MGEAEAIVQEKLTDNDGNVRDLVIWRVERSPRYPQGIRYRLAFVPARERRPAVLYDNHTPKGHHRHIRGVETTYLFRDVAQLLADFEESISQLWEK